VIGGKEPSAQSNSSCCSLLWTMNYELWRQINSKSNHYHYHYPYLLLNLTYFTNQNPKPKHQNPAINSAPMSLSCESNFIINY
jgi:hypothetical protein